MKKHVIVVAGPTAVGKTILSIQLAKQLNCPVISADSRQFYKEMTIGTAKPTEEDMQGVPHYFINHISIHDTYNIGQYEKEAIRCIDQLLQIHPQVIVVGGSGLYIHAILNGVDEFDNIPSHIRKTLIEEYQTKGLSFLQQQLKQKDEVYYHQVDLNNPQRIMRALEVCIHTQKPYSAYRTNVKKDRSFRAIQLLINTNREALYANINARVDDMMLKGLFDEVKMLYPFKHLNALNTVGYKELFEVLDQKTSLEEAVQRIKQNTRRYAKRQLTWFNHQGSFKSFEPNEFDNIMAYLELVLKHS